MEEWNRKLLWMIINRNMREMYLYDPIPARTNSTIKYTSLQFYYTKEYYHDYKQVKKLSETSLVGKMMLQHKRLLLSIIFYIPQPSYCLQTLTATTHYGLVTCWTMLVQQSLLLAVCWAPVQSTASQNCQQQHRNRGVHACVTPPSSCVSGMYTEEDRRKTTDRNPLRSDSRRGKKRLYWLRYDYNGLVGRVITTGSIIAEPVFEYQLRLNRQKRLRTAAKSSKNLRQKWLNSEVKKIKV